MASQQPLIQKSSNVKGDSFVIDDKLSASHKALIKNSCMNSDSFSQFYTPPVLKSSWWRNKTKTLILTALKILVPIAYICYMVYAVWYSSGRAGLLAWDIFLLIVWIFIFTKRPKRLVIQGKTALIIKIRLLISKGTYVRAIITIVTLLVIFGFLCYDWYQDKRKLVPFGGLLFFILIVFITSRSPSKVQWTPVIWGIILQFVLGMIILRWPTGYAVCQFIGDQVTAFLAYTDNGSRFVFGDEGLKDHPVVFKILPVVVFFSAIVNILYYLGAMQVIIKGIARVLRFAMKTSPMESFATSAHIFVGQVESSIALKPFINDVSRSELNAIMTGGFATVAGTVIGAYIEFGVPANHLIAASFMSAPAALAVSKLGWPEKKKMDGFSMDNISINVGKESNLMEAASAGATSTVKLIAYVVVNLIAFLAILSFVDAIISFYGDRVGHPEVNFEWLCSYIFMPLAVIMGIPWKDCRVVATLIGKKIVLNEFLAYIDLGNLMRENKIEGRSAVISTYILCGFGSIAAMGINLGALIAAEPRRRRDYARGVFRAFVCGNIACFMTACIAGMLYTEPLPVFSNSTDFNTTSNSSLFNMTSSNSSLFVINQTTTAGGLG
ncbi:solute carrier family 28 member 3-like isoform X2 [Mytilus californianus]|uniref:solute carrier family 28 member 3-like isoform X2 n=1 Tax=Mytilus californianus TaxID=6549 RepID=UPI002247623E|nr:solute carrier family 28 member 3-like isoform X2 [Mytilus californianus]XP_052073349.1 solute carrier family 28 member 3-like isoform X2 [Mytilus californianus]